MKKKKWLSTLAITSALLLGLTACGTANNDKESGNGHSSADESTTLVSVLQIFHTRKFLNKQNQF